MGRHVLCVLLASSLLAMTACGDDPRTVAPVATTTTKPISASGRADRLLDSLASNGDVDLFDHRYVAVLGGGDALLFIGTADDVAVAYYCDPTTGAAWLHGTADRGELQLVAANGASFQGAVVSDGLRGTLARTASNSGPVTLTEAPDAVIVREPGVPKGSLVGGLVTHDGVVRGFVGSTGTGTASSTPTTVPLSSGPTPDAAFGLTLTRTSSSVTGVVSVVNAQVAAARSAIEDARRTIEAIRQLRTLVEQISAVEKRIEELDQMIDELKAEEDKLKAMLANIEVLTPVITELLATNRVLNEIEPTWLNAALGQTLSSLFATSPVRTTTTTVRPLTSLPPTPTLTVTALKS